MTPSEALHALRVAIDDHPNKMVLATFFGILGAYGDRPDGETVPEVILAAVEAALREVGMPECARR